MRSALILTSLTVIIASLVAFSFIWKAPSSAQQAPIDCAIEIAPCQFETELGTVSLSLQPLPLSSNRPFELSLEIAGSQPDRIWADLQGKDMYMGVNQFELSRDSNLWSAEYSLALCSSGEMRWVLQLVFEKAQLQWVYTFEFDAH